VCVCACPPSCLFHVLTARRISLGGEGNALYPVLSSFNVFSDVFVVSVCVAEIDELYAIQVHTFVCIVTNIM